MEVMFDVETLSLSPNAVIVSLGAAKFDRAGRVWGTFFRRLDMESQLRGGREVSQSTLLWWLEQEESAMWKNFRGDRSPVTTALLEFSTWCHQDIVNHAGETTMEEVTRYWANGPKFDATLVESLAAWSGMSVPWTYRQLADMRTLVNESHYRIDDHVTRFEGRAHDPVHDSLVQAEIVTMCRQKLRERGGF